MQTVQAPCFIAPTKLAMKEQIAVKVARTIKVLHQVCRKDCYLGYGLPFLVHCASTIVDNSIEVPDRQTGQAFRKDLEQTFKRLIVIAATRHVINCTQAGITTVTSEVTISNLNLSSLRSMAARQAVPLGCLKD